MTDCYCDYDPPDFYKTRNVKHARTPHKCEECGVTINVGESYEYVAGSWDKNGLHIFSTCSRCVELRDWAKISFPCICIAHGSLHDDVRNEVAEAARHVPGLIFEWGRRMVRIRRAKRAAARPAAH